MDYSRFSYGDFVREEAYNASSQICYAFRRGTDERNGIVLSLGNMVSGLRLTMRYCVRKGLTCLATFSLSRWYRQRSV